MPKMLEWDVDGTRKYQNGCDRGVLWPKHDTGYQAGVAWTGLTGVEESPEGADENKFFADNIKYGSIRGAENYKGTIKCYTFPDEFEECNGMRSPYKGLTINQQTRIPFAFSWRTNIGSDANPDLGYYINIAYGCTCSPSSESHETMNEDPSMEDLSFEFSATPVAIPAVGNNKFKPSSRLRIKSTDCTKTQLDAIEALIYGSDSADSKCPTPEEIFDILKVS